MPLISCLMPTADRREFVPDAIRQFLDQDYPERELVILDDGRDAIADLVPADPRIRYRRLERKLVIGAKRNLAVREARGDILVHWDDDDWMAPWRLSYQWHELARSGTDACGVDRVWYLSREGPDAWQYVYPKGHKPWLCGGTLMYHRHFWERNPFPEVAQGEDTRFVWAVPRARFTVLENPDFYVARVHSRNTSRKHTRGAHWRPVPRAQVESIMRRPTPPPLASPGRPVVEGVASGSDSPAAEAEGARTPETITSDRSDEAPFITVSIPYFKAREYIRRAVTSILGQTHSRLRVVVVNDGDPTGPWRELADIHDPRLIRFHLPENRGRYFADAVVLAATPDAWFATQDADDWSEPDRLERLLSRAREAGADCAVSSIIHENATPGGGRRGRPDSAGAALSRPLDSSFRHRLWHHALFRTSVLRSLGGYYGGFRVGFDTLLMNLLLMSARVVGEERVLYHRLLRSGSLVHDRATGFQSRTRLTAVQQLARLYREAFAVQRASAPGIDPAVLRQRLRAIVTRGVPASERQALDRHSARLRSLLQAMGSPTNAWDPVRVRPSLTAPPLQARGPVSGTISTPSQGSGSGWAVTPELATALQSRCRTRPPRRVLELGSGRSTVVLAACARDLGFELVTLEHDPQYLRRTADALAAAGLSGHCHLTLSPLARRPVPERPDARWYSTPLEGRFDFIFADGPPGQIGRSAALFALQNHLSPDWELWLDDGERDHERHCVALWTRHLDCDGNLVPMGARSCWQLHARATQPQTVHTDGSATPGNGILLTLLTGGRPHLLERTLQALRASLGDRLDRIPGIALVNGGDAPTHRILDQGPSHWTRLEHRGDVLPIGAATSHVVQAALKRSDTSLVFHLEDDWEATAADGDWLGEAAGILTSDPAVGQVRLRARSERTLPYHMITRKPIAWRMRGTLAVAGSAHFTFNPSLVRAADAARIFPCSDEREAQRRFLRLGLATAQLIPGIFRHLGTRESLRERLGRS